MDVRLPITTAGICFAAAAERLLARRREARRPALKKKPPSSNSHWTPSPIRNSRTPSPNSAVRCCCSNAHSSNSTAIRRKPNTAKTPSAVLKHYPSPAGAGRHLHQRPVRAAQGCQLRLPHRSATGVPFQPQHSRRVPVPPWRGMAVGDVEQQARHCLISRNGRKPIRAFSSARPAPTSPTPMT